jgi:hypothetical protein
MDSSEPEEQLRRLKNTVRGASYRLSMLSRSGSFPPDAAGELIAVSRELEAAAGRLERLLAAFRQLG